MTTIAGFTALYIFLLAAFTGYEVISRVPVILHTPLMSGSNFVHGIVLVGAMVALGGASTTAERIIGFVAVLLGAGTQRPPFLTCPLHEGQPPSRRGAGLCGPPFSPVSLRQPPSHVERVGESRVPSVHQVSTTTGQLQSFRGRNPWIG